MTTAAMETLCRNGLKHVFVTQTRPHDTSAPSDKIDERVACQRCGKVAPGLDWDGPFDQPALTEETA